MSDRLYKLISEADVFTAPSKDELLTRWLQQIGATKNPDGSYDATGDVTIEKYLVKDGKLLIHFNKVAGYFTCTSLHLFTLEGTPQEIGRGFDCGYNNLKSLDGAPKKVGGFFFCNNNSAQFTEEDVRAVCDVKGRIIV